MTFEQLKLIFYTIYIVAQNYSGCIHFKTYQVENFKPYSYIQLISYTQK